MFVIYGSSRPNGNTELLAKIMLEDINHEAVFLRDKKIKPISDMRHDPQGFQRSDDDYYEIIETMLNHDEVVFATPIYWYGMSGLMKNFIDRWSESLRERSLNFRERMKDKKMYLLIVGSDQPHFKGLPLIMQFEHICNFVGASFEGFIIGDANSPGQILSDENAIVKAKQLNNILRNK